MSRSMRQPVRACHEARPALGSLEATTAAMDARTSAHYLPATNQTVATRPPFTKRNASSSNNRLSDEVASYRANLMRSQRLKKSSNSDVSSPENGEAFAIELKNSIDVCRVAGNPNWCVTYVRRISDTRMLNSYGLILSISRLIRSSFSSAMSRGNCGGINGFRRRTSMYNTTPSTDSARNVITKISHGEMSE